MSYTHKTDVNGPESGKMLLNAGNLDTYRTYNSSTLSSSGDVDTSMF